MEFAGFQLQHQLQEESPPPDYNQSWIPCNIYINGSTCTTNGFLTHSKELGQHKHGMIDSLIRTNSTEKDFGFHHGKSFTQQPQPPATNLLPATIKDKGLSDESHSLISISEPRYPQSFFSNPCLIGKEFLPSENFYHVHKSIYEGMKRYNNFGAVSSISNLSTLDMTSSLVSCSLGLNSQMLDLHTSNYDGSCGLQLCYDTFGLNEGISYSNIHGREHSPSNSSNKVSTLTSEVAMTNKRPTNCSRSKESEAKANKKSRPSCPPLKVRKEKLGDRIQTLQRLVAPCGKTSTASVLTEAIGYIHFLHQQIQTLSLPYIKSAQSKPYRMVQLDSRKEDNREFKPDLRSRGLCLVPLSYASFIHRCA